MSAISSYILYVFISFSGSTVEPIVAPQEYFSQKTCDAAAKLLTHDLATKLDNRFTINTYCLEK